ELKQLFKDNTLSRLEKLKFVFSESSIMPSMSDMDDINIEENISEKLEEKINIISNYFTNFTNFIELDSFRSFLLLTLTSQSSTNILAQFGLGGDKETINLPYDPVFNIYYQKVNLMSPGSLIIYFKGEPITKEYLLKKDDENIKKFLSANEMSLAFRGKEKFLFPQVSDCSNFNGNKFTVEVDDLFHTFQSFISYTQPHIVFVMDAEKDSIPDLIFTFNMMPQLPRKVDEDILKVDVYLDPDHKTRKNNYIKRESNFKIEFLTDIKDISHSELYNSSFSLALHVKSLTKPI
ncbi:MAG: hypothetical protein ACFFKA_13825, partial [Candidatus Thorarchaeota archaeon]